jgi:hypothetical protein
MIAVMNSCPRPPRCTPGVYLSLGSRGGRIGESACIERRAPVSARTAARCLGTDIRTIVLAFESNPLLRRQLEASMIRLSRHMFIAARLRSCNPVDR